MSTNLERAREQLAAWMIEHSFATGHGDTFEDLLKELSWQVKELRGKQAEARLAALEEAARLCEHARHNEAHHALCNPAAIRALAQAAAPAKGDK